MVCEGDALAGLLFEFGPREARSAGRLGRPPDGGRLGEPASIHQLYPMAAWPWASVGQAAGPNAGLSATKVAFTYGRRPTSGCTLWFLAYPAMNPLSTLWPAPTSRCRQNNRPFWTWTCSSQRMLWQTIMVACGIFGKALSAPCVN